MSPRTPSPISKQARQLAEEHARIMREMADAEKALRQKPKATKPKPAAKPRVRINTVAAVPLTPLAGDLRANRSPRRTARRRRVDARVAQIKFLMLCLLLVGLMLFLWKNLPG
jgi:hypothetical protein